MQPKNDPAKVAAGFRVQKKGERDFELRSDAENLPLSIHGIDLHIETVPHIITWRDTGRSGPHFLTEFHISKLEIGVAADGGWYSSLGNDCFFVVDGEALRHVTFSSVSVLSEEQLKLRRVYLLHGRKGTTFVTETEKDVDSGSTAGHAMILHIGAIPDHKLAESVLCAIGLSEANFQRLIDGCLAGHIKRVYFKGSGIGLSSSASFGAARDLILQAQEYWDFDIDELSIEYRV